MVLKRSGAACRIDRAEIQIGQAPFEETRHFGADRMRVEQDHIAVPLEDQLDLRGQRLVVGPPVLLETVCADLGIGRGAGQPDVLVREGARRAQFGIVGARIEFDVVRIAIEIDDVPRIRRRDQRCAERQRMLIEERHMPVGVGRLFRGGCHPGKQILRDIGSGVRNIDQQRSFAGDQHMQWHRVHVETSLPPTTRPIQGLAPKA